MNGRSMCTGLLAFALLSACSSETTTPAAQTDAAVADTSATDTSSTEVAIADVSTADANAGETAVVECDIVAQDCPSGSRCVETREGAACGARCFADKGGAAVQGATCVTPDDCAKGFACIKVGDAGFTCARYCSETATCTGGSTCQKLSNCTIGAWTGGKCY